MALKETYFRSVKWRALHRETRRKVVEASMGFNEIK